MQRWPHLVPDKSFGGVRGPESFKQDEPSLENHNLSHFFNFHIFELKGWKSHFNFLEQKQQKMQVNGTKRYQANISKMFIQGP